MDAAVRYYIIIVNFLHGHERRRLFKKSDRERLKISVRTVVFSSGCEAQGLQHVRGCEKICKIC